MNSPWDNFAHEKLKKIFDKKRLIIDIGGGLRIDEQKGNRKGDENSWLKSYLDKVEYKILDKVADFNPDFVADIHKLPFKDNSIDAIICIAVLEHVENPSKAIEEMHRVLKTEGYCYIYVPFLYYYHPLPGYYQDFYRFTYDGIRYLTRDFGSVEIQNVRGATETLLNLCPWFSKKNNYLCRWLDRFLGKTFSKQTSGFNVFCVK